MLYFAVQHIAALNATTSNRDMKLRQYKLSEDEWDVACQLLDILQVCILL